MKISIIIPMLNEAEQLPALFSNLKSLSPQPNEILFVDGGSEDGSRAMSEDAGYTAVTSQKAGRSSQINKGVQMTDGDIVCILHADSALPCDAVSVIRKTMMDRKIVLASFTPRIAGPNGTRWGTSFHNWIKTWYTPILFRPIEFLRGTRLLFGDHAMFFRTHAFQAIGGMDESISIMEEADLCIAIARLGKIKMVPRWVWTSDRRIRHWGPIKANLIYFKVGIMWAFGARQALSKHYPDIR